MKAFKTIDEVRRRMGQPGFEEELIQEVRSRPVIWNRKNKYYNNRILHDQQWNEIGIKLGCPKESCKAKWRNLRDVFMKEVKKDYSKWAHFHHLTFLKDIAVCKKRGEEESDEDDDRREDVLSEESMPGSHLMEAVDPLAAQSPEVLDSKWPETKILTGTDVTSSAPSRKRTRSPSPQYARQATSEIPLQAGSVRYLEEDVVRPEPDDEDMLFMRSLVPYLKHLPPVQKLRLRGKIENLIADEIGNYTS